VADPSTTPTAQSRKGEREEREERGQANTHTHTIKTPSHLQMAAGIAIDEFNTLVKLKNKRGKCVKCKR
jgi:hypothetical protein